MSYCQAWGSLREKFLALQEWLMQRYVVCAEGFIEEVLLRLDLRQIVQHESILLQFVHLKGLDNTSALLEIRNQILARLSLDPRPIFLKNLKVVNLKQSTKKSNPPGVEAKPDFLIQPNRPAKLRKNEYYYRLTGICMKGHGLYVFSTGIRLTVL